MKLWDRVLQIFQKDELVTPIKEIDEKVRTAQHKLWTYDDKEVYETNFEAILLSDGYYYRVRELQYKEPYFRNVFGGGTDFQGMYDGSHLSMAYFQYNDEKYGPEYNDALMKLMRIKDSMRVICSEWDEMIYKFEQFVGGDFHCMYNIAGTLVCLHSIDNGKYYEDRADAVNAFNQSLIDKMKQ